MGCIPSKTSAAAKVEEPSASTLLQTAQGGAEVKPAAPAAPAETTEPANAQVVEAEAVKAEEQKTDLEVVKETAELKLETAEVKQEKAEVKQVLKQETAEVKQKLNELMELTIMEVKPEERPVQSFWMGCCDCKMLFSSPSRRSNQRGGLLRASG
ncbi:unnamed protein product [Polarella glacialis]|uniref:Uncharacterized protein n=1 Tax=Polarella glacialis TaxID=89957 RepID=A0A813L6Z7_POLGL|nr:unnamed protein product [Polarella glacialis]CAE8722679.1 unnamed protein product [Polarella glacialis]